jgi:alpha-tubulin suppressor-like RCC1 family protein
MRPRLLPRASWLAVVVLAAVPALVRCASPTGIRVSVYSEVTCDKHADVALAGGSSFGDLATKAPAATSTTCVPADANEAFLGDVVVTPSGDKSGEIAFELMTRPDGQPAETCTDAKNAAQCIVARRQLHFSPHDVLGVRVDLRLSCLGVPCAIDQTCVRGACVAADVKSDCSQSCDESSLGAGTVTPDGGPPPPPPPTDSGADAGPPTNLNPLAAGAAHTCAITATGGVKCWGDNSRGELGTGDNGERHVPEQVVGLTSGVVSLSAGLNFTCALMADTTVQCWGKNDYGELANGKNADLNVPVVVQGIHGARSIATGCKHACAVLDTGAVKCWGWNEKGQLGDGTLNNQNLPVDVHLVSDALFVTAGFEYTCAATRTGAKCWGEDSTGQLGDGKTANSSLALDATALKFAPTILTAGASHVFAFGAPGGMPLAVTWGQNPGTGGVAGVIEDANAGDGFTCILRNGGVGCWGTNNSGVLGNGGTAASATPVTPTGLGTNVVALRTGYDHSCVFTKDAKVKCWGTNGNGQLGNNSIMGSGVPVDAQWP